MGVLASLRSFFSPRTLTVAGKTYTLQQFADRFAKGLYWGANVDTGVDTSQPYSQSVWVYAAVSLIASGISRMPLIVSDPDGRHPVTSGPLYDLLQQPNPKQVLSDFVEETFITTLLDGHVFWEIEGLTASGLDAVRVQNLRRLYAEIRVNERGEDFAPLWRRRMTNEPLFPGVNLFERKLHNPYNDVYGLSPIAAAQLAIYGDVAAGVYNERFFKNGGLPSIMFSTDDPGFTQEHAKEAQARYEAERNGPGGWHRPLFAGNNLKPYRTGLSHNDIEYGQLKQLSKSEILAIYHVPETLLGATKPAAGVTIGGGERAHDQEAFMLNTVMPWGDWFAAWFTRQIVRPFYPQKVAWFDYKQVPILQDRHLDRAKEGREWIKAGATFNEVNRIFDLGFESHPWGDDYWIPANMVPARLAMNGPVVAQQPPAPPKDEDKNASLRLCDAA
jgi:HK97 family phage portal protein